MRTRCRTNLVENGEDRGGGERKKKYTKQIPNDKTRVTIICYFFRVLLFLRPRIARSGIGYLYKRVYILYYIRSINIGLPTAQTPNKTTRIVGILLHVRIRATKQIHAEPPVSFRRYGIICASVIVKFPGIMSSTLYRTCIF